MKVLVVEDSQEKAAEACASIRQAILPATVEIEHAHSFVSAIRRLEAVTFDLLILDIVLPIRDGEAPALDGGKKVLSEVVSGGECRRPSHIICLTAFDDSAQLLRDELDRSLVHMVLYKETGPAWREALVAKTKYVHQRLNEADLLPRDFRIDVAIITSSPSIELTEVKKLPGDFVSEYHQSDALDYYTAKWQTSNQRELSVIACAAPQMGMTAACVTACKVIERWRPRFLAMAGIAAGTRRDHTHFGDILVAEATYDYGSGKILEQDSGERVFIPSPSQIPVDADLFPILQRWEREQTRMDEIRRAWYSQTRESPRLIIGLIATGAAVVQDKKLVEEILSKSRKVVGLDMEAYAVFQAARLASAPRPRVIVAKSICDFADSEKSDEWQQYAAFTSARFIYEFFANAVELGLGRPVI